MIMNTKTIKYTIEFYSDWHCGSGLAAGAEADSVVIKDRNGLPYVPGKTIKGLVREAYMTLYNEADLPSGMFFSNAELSDGLKYKILSASEPLTEYLYHNVASIAMKDGIAVDGSLRTIQVTVPCILTATIKNVGEGEDVQKLEKALKYVKHIGYCRNRGLGRCRLSIVEVYDETIISDKSVPNDADRLYFRCKLKSDVVLTQTSATSGPQSSLDFIPGSCFWGIVAHDMYKNHKDHVYDVLYSGCCRFGDAHPASENYRGIRTPASFYYEKDKDIFAGTSKAYVSHKVDNWKEGIQPKQCRGGFVTVVSDNEEIVIAKINTSSNMAIKTAWSRETRSPEKSQLYTYESLDKGLELLFWIELSGVDKQRNAEIIINALSGIKRVGRSRSAQYGLVEISMVTDKECCMPESDMSSACDDLYAVYADSRLIFLDSSGQPHYQPSARDLGFSEGEILWEKSQIRTFGYSSFNSRRGAYNSDYTGIEKGSVLIVKSPVPPSGDEWVGSFKSEGFGHVIYNPSFFKVKEDEDGKGVVSACRFCKADNHDAEYHSGSITDKEAGLVTWLESSRKESDVMSGIFGLNNKMTQFFNASVAASQWGQIRQIAMVSDTYDALRKSIVTFITEGLRKDFWRGKAGKDLMNYLDKDIVELLEQYEADKDRFAPMAVVNLASIMASKPKLSGRSKVNKGE